MKQLLRCCAGLLQLGIVATALAQSSDEFGSTATPGCCETQECQQQAYRQLEQERYAAAKACVEARQSPCDIQPELKLPPLCAPRLEGKAERTQLEGGIEQNDTTDRGEPPKFIEQIPKLDPREKPPPTNPPVGPPPQEKVTGKRLPPRAPPKVGSDRPPTRPPARPPARPTRTVSDGGLVREATVSGAILQRRELPGDPGAGGTPSTPMTRAYFFSKGVADGLADSGPAAGESAMHLHLGAWYLLTGRPQSAQAELHLIPGASVTLRSLAKDLDDWSRILGADPTRAGSVQDAYDRGRLFGQQLGGKLLEKYGGVVLDPHRVPVVTEPPPVPGKPAPSDALPRGGP